MRVSPSAESCPNIALILILAVMSALSDQDESAHHDTEHYEYDDIHSHLDGNDSWDNSSSAPPQDWLQPEDPCLPLSLLNDIFGQYLSVPRFLLTLARHNACQGLEGHAHYSGPQWLVDATTAGECPWHLVRREFLHETFPPAILEVSCLCDGYRCSLQGDFECISVKQEVKVWSSEATGSSRYQSHLLQVTAACLCVQRHASQADHLILGQHK